MNLSSCRTCGGELTEFLELGAHPFADSFFATKEEARSARTFDLTCAWCNSCSLIQLNRNTSDDDRYNGVDYSYTSSNSRFARSHWDSFASYATSIMPSAKKVLEVGSNDGYLLSQFVSAGADVLGIDASERMANIANSNGIPTLKGLFGLDLAQGLDQKFDLVIANNVANHANDPLDFFSAVKQVLAPEGSFVFEVPAVEAMLASGRYDQIYLEHVTYWSRASIASALSAVDLHLTNAELVDYHGGSIRGVVGHDLGRKSFSNEQWPHPNPSLDSVRIFADHVQQTKLNSLAFLDRYRDETHGKLAGIGAAAKANTAINFLGLQDHLMFVTDSSAEKIGKFTPASALEIRDDSALATENVEGALILAWNISSDLSDKLLSINPTMKVKTL